MNLHGLMALVAFLSFSTMQPSRSRRSRGYDSGAYR